MIVKCASYTRGPSSVDALPVVAVLISATAAQWSKTAKNTDFSTGPRAHPFTRSLAPLTPSLAPDCSLCARPPLRSLTLSLAHSLARGKVNDSMSQNNLVLSHSAAFRLKKIQSNLILSSKIPRRSPNLTIISLCLICHRILHPPSPRLIFPSFLHSSTPLDSPTPTLSSNPPFLRSSFLPLRSRPSSFFIIFLGVLNISLALSTSRIEPAASLKSVENW